MAFASSHFLTSRRSSERRRPRLLCSANPPTQISTCTGPTCKQAGSAAVLLSLKELSRDVDGVAVGAVGCLGECGNGPNIGVSCRGTTPRIYTRVKTAVDIVNLLRSVGHEPSTLLLEALEKKQNGDRLLNADNPRDALSEYNAAVDMLTLRPQLLVRVLCNRSAAFCQMGMVKEAVKDANEAIAIDPGLSGAWKRKAEAHELLNETKLAVEAWTVWGKLTGKSEECSRRIRKLRGWGLPFFR